MRRKSKKSGGRKIPPALSLAASGALALALAAAVCLAVTGALLGGSREFMYLRF